MGGPKQLSELKAAEDNLQLWQTKILEVLSGKVPEGKIVLKEAYEANCRAILGLREKIANKENPEASPSDRYSVFKEFVEETIANNQLSVDGEIGKCLQAFDECYNDWTERKAERDAAIQSSPFAMMIRDAAQEVGPSGRA